MKQYVVEDESIEVSGQGILALLNSFGGFTLLASEMLAQEGVAPQNTEGMVEVKPEGWYSLAKYLRAYKQITSVVGEQVIYQVGLNMPKHARFPDFIRDVPSAMQSMDAAYGMNHRKNGVPMFDPQTGQRTPGIGSYKYEKTEGKNAVTMFCDNPYPCVFDRALLTAMAQRFDPKAQLKHDDRKPCRHKGGDSCTYLINW
ncbi:MAG TPA: hypothetical protein VE153_05230 [Myxococcus sp.]|nr:hypothetical protein [Myxococcus sp.]